MILETLLLAICFIESGGDPLAFNYKDGKGVNNHSFGYCQVTYRTALELGFPPQKGCLRDFRGRIGRSSEACSLFDRGINMEYAKMYLMKQVVRYNKDYNKAISAYNAGSYFRSNRKYVLKVLRKYRDLGGIK